jgi:hypothetical protein
VLFSAAPLTVAHHLHLVSHAAEVLALVYSLLHCLSGRETIAAAPFIVERKDGKGPKQKRLLFSSGLNPRGFCPSARPFGKKRIGRKGGRAESEWAAELIVCGGWPDGKKVRNRLVHSSADEKESHG